MYYRHFELSGPPFQMTPSTSVLYLGKAHRECLCALEWALLHESCGFMLLVGETGVGKTTLLCTILARQLNDVRLACVTNPRLSFEEIMRVLLKQLGSTISFGNRLELIEEFERIISEQPQGQRTAIIIDEAQDLSDDSLEDVRLLANCADSQLTGLQFVLMGQPELLERLAAPNLRQIRERISAKATLIALSRAESIEYVECRLKARNGKINRIFEHDALLRIADASAGIPRRLNVLCHNALLLAYSEGAAKVDARMADEVIKDFESIYLNARPAPAAEAAPQQPAIQPASKDAPMLLEDVVGVEPGAPKIEAVKSEVAKENRVEPKREINRFDAKRAELSRVEAVEPARNAASPRKRRSSFGRSAMVLAAFFILGLGAVLLTAQNATGRALMRSAGLITRMTVNDVRPSSVVVVSAPPPVHEEIAAQPSAAPTASNAASPASNGDTAATNQVAGAPVAGTTVDAKFVLSTPEFIPSISPSAASDQRRKVQVSAGDTMHDLAERYLGSVQRTKELIAMNPQIKNPDVLFPGDAVYLPSDAR
jgi:general secretion pathway protein A